MAKQVVNIGNSANDGAGDPLRTAFDKINDNFTELYTASPVTSQITQEGNKINTNVSNANLELQGNGTGGVLAGAARPGDRRLQVLMEAHQETCRRGARVVRGRSASGRVSSPPTRMGGILPRHRQLLPVGGSLTALKMPDDRDERASVTCDL